MRTISRCLGALAVLQIISSEAALAGEVVHVKISDLAFSPAEITAKVGDTLEWENADFIDHTATAADGQWDIVVVSGKAARLHLKKTGTTSYFCRFHPNMTAIVHVTAK